MFMMEGQLFPGSVEPSAMPKLLSTGLVDDSAIVYRVDQNLVLKVSPPAFPNVAREMAEKADMARDCLGDGLNWAVARVLRQWEANGVSCALFEALTSISDNRVKRFVQVKRLAPAALKWLRDVAALDRGITKQGEACLQALADCPYATLGGPAKAALGSVQSGAFVPRSRIMHSDFWVGNVMLDPTGARPFVLIDWRGSTVDGFPIFDLIKFAQSAGVGRKALRAELAAHAERLGCDIRDTRSYLLAALGYIWMHLEQFPPERFLVMGENCLATLDNALNG
jgi:hypothetical protein